MISKKKILWRSLPISKGSLKVKESENFDEPTKPIGEKKWYVLHAAEIAILFWVVIMGTLLILMD